MTAGAVVGWHPAVDGERLDLLAYRYLDNATFAWVLCVANNAVVPDALTAREMVAILRAER